MQGSSLDWPSLLLTCRDARERSPPPSYKEIQSKFAVHFADIALVLRDYSESLQAEQKREKNRVNQDGSEEEDAEKRARSKAQILNVRNALRFGVSCISLASSADAVNDREGNTEASVRSKMQEEAIIDCNLHEALAQVLTYRGMDSKSRLLASRLLSNLIAANKVTSEVITKDIALSPTDSYRTRQLLNTMSLSDNVADGQGLNNMELSWVDMMISSAARNGDRGAVGAIVAALYNAMIALQDEDNEGKAQTNALPARIASDRTLMCIFMRHILPADTIKPASENAKGENSAGDDATEWISLLVTQISTYGYLSNMYQATGINTASASSGEGAAAIVTPEQIVLLHCLASSLDDWADDTSADASACPCPLGGASGQQVIIASCRFLAEQASVLRQSIIFAVGTEAYEGEKNCRMSAYLSMLEMLAAMLSSDDKNKSRDHAFYRIYLGKETSLLSDTIVDLGILVDKLSMTNRGVKARELNIDNVDQRLAVVLVRLIGNMCYKCISNQDLVRETQVPFPDNISITPDRGSVIVRSGLHFLLSCTSFSSGCFTLREWALVAIRNLLDENEQNQDVVAKLEAQKTVDTPELNNLGVKTVIDEQGKVRVEPRG